MQTLTELNSEALKELLTLLCNASNQAGNGGFRLEKRLEIDGHDFQVKWHNEAGEKVASFKVNGRGQILIEQEVVV